MVHRLNSWERRIACILHPEASGIVESDKFGGIRTEVGPAGWILQSGDRVTLRNGPVSMQEAHYAEAMRDAAMLETLAGVRCVRRGDH